MTFLPWLTPKDSVSVNSLLCSIGGEEGAVRTCHLIFGLFVAAIPFRRSRPSVVYVRPRRAQAERCKQVHLALTRRSELGVGWRKDLDVTFQKLSANFDTLLPDLIPRMTKASVRGNSGGFDRCCQLIT